MANKPKPESSNSYEVGEECVCCSCEKEFTVATSEEATFGSCEACITLKVSRVS